MCEIHYELCEGEFDVAEFSRDGSERLIITVSDQNGRDVFGKDAFFELFGETKRAVSGCAAFDVPTLPDGEKIEPRLILKSEIRTLPPLTVKSGEIYLPDCDADYARFSTKRIKAISREIERLEEKVLQLERCVYGTSVL